MTQTMTARNGQEIEYLRDYRSAPDADCFEAITADELRKRTADLKSQAAGTAEAVSLKNLDTEIEWAEEALSLADGGAEIYSAEDEDGFWYARIPAAKLDESDYTNIIDNAISEWFAASPCTTPKDEDADEAINLACGGDAQNCMTHLLRTQPTAAEVTASVKAGLDAWYGEKR